MKVICPKCYKSNFLKADLFFEFIPCEYCSKKFCSADADVIFEEPEEEKVVKKLSGWLNSAPNPSGRIFNS